MKLKTKVALYAAAAATGTAFLSGGVVGASASQPEKPQTATVVSSNSDAVWLIGCLSYGDGAQCSASKFDKTVAKLAKQTKNMAEVKKTCRKGQPSAWYVGYCSMVEDDSSKLTLRMSDLGMIARTRLVIK